MTTNQFKKIIFAALFFSTGFATPVFAQSDAILREIANNTAATMRSVAKLPDYIQQGTEFIIAWMSSDSSETSISLKEGFVNYEKSITADYKAQANAALQQRLLKDFFGDATPQSFKNANDLVYQIFPLQAQKYLYFTNDERAQNGQNPDYAYNYLRWASGLNVSHIYPQNNWSGRQVHRDRYLRYYNSISAVQTYNGYALSQLYANYGNGDNLSKTQKTLLDQATADDWFKQVATENIGIVLRQLLMYTSQLYVVLNHMYDLEKQMLTAQTMNNTLLILLNQNNEDIMIKKADGTLKD